MTSRAEPAVSVVLAEAPGSRSCAASVQAIAVAARGRAVEIIVVQPPGTPEPTDAADAALVRVPGPKDALVPVQWGLGLARARSPLVAFLTTELLVEPRWLEALVPLLEGNVVGAAGGIEVQPGPGATAVAIHLARFSAFLPRAGEAPSRVGDLPGDGAIYRRDAITPHGDLLRAGFFEVEFHRRFRAQGQALVQSRETLVRVAPTASLFDAAGLRFRHGYGHGATRVRLHRENRVRILALAPAVPLLLLGRIARRAGLERVGAVVRALVPLGVLTAAWASGEALGAVTARGRADGG